MYKTYAIKGDEKILVTKDNIFLLNGYEFINEQVSELEEFLLTATTQELIDTELNFYFLGYTGKQKGDLLVDKLLGGNPNLEHYYIRTNIGIVNRKVFQDIDPTLEEQAFLEYIEGLGESADLILEKFKEPIV